MYYVYALGDPRDGDIYYIGFTTNPPKRWALHCTRSQNYSLHSRLHVRNKQILKSDYPRMVVLETFDDRDKALRAEQTYIRIFRSNGYTLTNNRNH